jgi:hypothetical protein
LSGGFANTITNWGAVMFPTNAKMYLVSASRPDFTLALATNGAGAQTANNSYANSTVNSLDGWVKQFSNGVTVAPASIVGSWTDRGEFLHVRTIDIAGIFNETRAAQQKAIEQEDKNLEEIARALVAAIQATGTIPNPTISASAGWVAQVAGYSSLGANAIQYSFPANSIGERRLYLDLSLNPYVGAPPPPGGWNSLPGVPASAYLVSVSKEDGNILNLDTINGGTKALEAADLTFLRTWQKVPDSSGIYIANNAKIVTADWANRGEFLHVRSIDLRSLFCRVTLIDTAAPENVAGFTSVLGNGYVPNSAIAVNVGNNVITFASDGAGNLPVQTASSSQIAGYNSRHDVIAPTAIPPGTAKYTGPTSPPAPSYDLIANVGPGSGKFLVNQTQIFYVLKGQSINLFDGANALNRSVIIQSDVQYKYFNNTWIPVD